MARSRPNRCTEGGLVSEPHNLSVWPSARGVVSAEVASRSSHAYPRPGNWSRRDHRFFLVGRMRGSWELQWVSLQMFVALAVVSIAVYLTGSPASHQSQRLGVSREIIQRHSQSADFSFTFIEALGAISLAILVKFRITRQIPTRFSNAWLALAFITDCGHGQPPWAGGSGIQKLKNRSSNRP